MAIYDLPLSELERYLPDLDEPADLDEFWSTTLAEARGHDLALQVTPVPTGLRLVDVDDRIDAHQPGKLPRARTQRGGYIRILRDLREERPCELGLAEIQIGRAEQFVDVGVVVAAERLAVDREGLG